MADTPKDPLQESAKKMMKAMKAKGPKQAKPVNNEESPAPPPMQSRKVQTQVDNEQQGPVDPDQAVMEEAQKLAPKKKAASAGGGSKSRAPKPALSNPEIESEPPPVSSEGPGTKGGLPRVEQVGKRAGPAVDSSNLRGRRAALLDEYGDAGSKVNPNAPRAPDFETLERDMPKGGPGGGYVSPRPGINIPPEALGELGAGGAGGPLTVAAITAHLALDPTKTGIGQGEDDVYSNRGTKLPQEVKRNRGPVGLMNPGTGAYDAQKDSEEAKYAEILRQNYPDQIRR